VKEHKAFTTLWIYSYKYLSFLPLLVFFSIIETCKLQYQDFSYPIQTNHSDHKSITMADTIKNAAKYVIALARPVDATSSSY